ncbi:MAG: hypothetical protein J1F04_02940 [Oscillospiraceae bacterium]|nr:hypothetical protein [Oscillospiraceae bacterium]
MTKTNSTADFFLKYLRYKLGKDKLLFFLSVIMGLLSFVNSTVAIFIIMLNKQDIHNTNYDYWIAASELSLLAGAVMLGVVVAAAIMSFNFCLQRHETDMLGSLPVSHRARFWGDLLSGYALSVLPYSLIAVICIPFIAPTERYIDSTLYTEYFAYVVLTTFFSLTLLYALTVLAVSICGRMASTIACTIIFVTASMNVIPGAARFFMASIAGMPAREIYYRIEKLTPTLYELYMSLNVLLSNVPILRGIYAINPETGLRYTAEEHFRNIVNNTAASDFVNIIVWTAEIAVIIAAAFFLTKFRKAERTGGAFGHKYGYYAVLFVYVVVIFLINSGYLIESYITTAILSAVVFLVFEIAMRRGWKKFGIGAAALAGSLALTMGAAWIVRDTGAFGLRNRLPDANDIVTAYFDGCEFTDREDIEQLRKNHLEFLKNYGNAVETAEGYGYYSHEIVYKLKNGETFTRCYRALNEYSTPINQVSQKCENALESLPFGLKNYEEQLLLNFDASKYTDCDILLKDAFGGVILKPGKMHEFAEILIGEYTSNGKKGKIIGSVEFYDADNRYYIRPLRMDIYDSYTKTAEFLRNKENIIIPQNDGETLCYNISHPFGQEPHYELNILKKDLENEKVKELISLLTDKFNILHDSGIRVYSNDLHNELYVPTQNQTRFTMLVFEIFAERISDN